LRNIVLIISLVLFSCSTIGERKFQLKYEVELSPIDGKMELWIPVPQSNEVQTISNIIYKMDNLDYVIKEELDHGNKYIYVLSADGIASSKTISITFDVLRKEHRNKIYAGVDPNKYLGSYSMAPTGDMFSSIIDDEKLSSLDIRAIYNYVLSGMHYGKPKSINDKYYQDPWLNDEDLYGKKEVTRDKVLELYKIAKTTKGNYTFGNGNSIYACNIGVGNCTDYHSYFMSLGSTLNIPVRFHMGFSIPLDDSGIVGGYHCWADYYVDGEGWHPVDISEADKAPDRVDYFFGTICENRVDMMVGRDFILDGYDNGRLNLFIYPQLEINDQISFNYKKSFSYKNL